MLQHIKNLIVTDGFYLHLFSCRSKDAFGSQNWSSSSFKSFHNFHSDNKVIKAQHDVVKPKFLLILKEPQNISTWLSQPHLLLIKHIKPPTLCIYFTNFSALLLKKLC